MTAYIKYHLYINNGYGGDAGRDYLETVSYSASYKRLKSNISATVSIEGWTYGETAKNPTVSGNTGNGTVTYTYQVNKKGNWISTQPTTAGTHTVKASIAETDDYNGGEATADFTIAKKAIGLEWTNTTFTYDGQSHAPTATISGVLGGDTCTVTVTGGQTNAGTHTATASGLSNSNYTLPDAGKTQTFTIDKKAVTVTASDQTVELGGSIATTADKAVLTGAVSGHTLDSVTLTPSDTSAVTTAGTITPSNAVIKDSGSNDVTGNYNIAYTKGTLTVTKVAPTYTAPTANTLTYNGTDQALVTAGSTSHGQITYSTAQNGTYSASVPTGKNAGSYEVWWKLTGDNDHSDVAPTKVAVTIGAKSVAVSGLTAADKVYDGTTTATLNATGATFADKASGDTLTIASGDAAFEDAGVRDSKKVNFSNLVLGGASASNYTLSATTATGTGKITARPITITAVDQTVQKDAPVVSGVDKVSVAPGALLTGHSITAATLSGDTTSVTNNEKVKISSVTIKDNSGAGADVTANYNITYATGKLTVTKTNPTVTVAPTVKTGLIYNKTAQELINTGTVTGGTLYYRIGDNGTWSAEEPKATNAGSYAVSYYVKGDSDHSDIGSEANPTSLGAVTIAQKEVGLTWTNTGFNYDGAAHCPTATATNLESGDTCTVTVTGAKADVGSHTATATALSNANYKLPASATQSFTISGAKVVNNDNSAVTAPKRGDTLKAKLEPTDGDYSYQWYRGDTVISGATNKTYTLTNDDVGKTIKVVIKKEGTDYPSAPVGPVAQVYAVEGIVVKSNGTTPVSGITVKLMQGKTLFGQGTTDTNGKFTINNVPKGSYNLVANGMVDGTQLTKTQILELSADAADVKVVMPEGKTESVLDNGKAGDFAAVVDGLDDRAEKAQPVSGEMITIQMTITSEENVTNENRLTDDDKTAFAKGKDAIAALPAASGKTMEYMNIKLDETNSNSSSVHNDIGNTNTTVMKIIMQYNFTNRYSVTVFRYHGTTAVALTKGSGTDGTFETNEAAGTITIYASKFSTYAIGYSTTPPASTTTSGGGSGGWAILPTRYPVETEQTEHGTTEASHKEAAAGTKVIITPRPGKSYEAASATVRDKDGKFVPVTKEQDGTWSFTMPSGKVTVSVSYTKAVITPADTGVAEWLVTDDHLAYLNGYDEDGVLTIRPSGNITRAEVAAIFYRLLKNNNVTITRSYTDVPDGAWYAQAVGVLSSLGILNGYEEGDFRPQNPITRAEFTAVATRFAKAAGGTADFLDVPGSHWAYGSIATAADYGWVSGYGDGSFGPKGNITRAEVAAIVNRMLGRKADQAWVRANSDKIKSFSDLQDTKQWYYFDMIEASNAHDFTMRDGEEKWTN